MQLYLNAVAIEMSTEIIIFTYSIEDIFQKHQQTLELTLFLNQD